MENQQSGQVINDTPFDPAERFSEQDVRRMGRTARGVRGIKLRDGDRAVGMVVARDGATLLTLCEGGYGKRTEVDEYRLQSRGGLGVKNIRTSKRNGRVVEIAMVLPDDDLMLITAQGMIIRTRVGEISLIGRDTQGVKVMNLKSGDRLLSGAVVASEEAVGEPESSPESVE